MKNYISLANKLKYLFKKENNVDLTILSTFPKYFNNSKELELFLQKARFSNVSEIVDLSMQIQNNTNHFLKLSIKLNQEEIIDKISNEITKQTEENTTSVLYASRRDDCGVNFI